MTKKAFPANFLLILTLLAPVCGQSQQLIISLIPQIDIPISPDHNLFQTSGGVMVTGRKPARFLRPLSIGFAGAYHLGRMQHVTLGNLGSLSIFSTEIISTLHWTIRQKIGLSISGGAGFFHASENGRLSSYASDLTWSGRIGIGFITSDKLTIGIQSKYRNYRRLYHFVGIGLAMDFRLGNNSRNRSQNLNL